MIYVYQSDGGIDMVRTHAYARFGLWFLLAVAIAGGAIAQTAATNVLPRQAEIGYLNGGIGQEQAALMRDMSSQFPVRMTFSQHNEGQDEFLADVPLHITDSRGRTVLDLPSQGPIFLLRLPPGSYAVEAEHQGEVKTRRFDVVAGRHDDLTFSWS